MDTTQRTRETRKHFKILELMSLLKLSAKLLSED